MGICAKGPQRLDCEDKKGQKKFCLLVEFLSRLAMGEPRQGTGEHEKLIKGEINCIKDLFYSFQYLLPYLALARLLPNYLSRIYPRWLWLDFFILVHLLVLPCILWEEREGCLTPIIRWHHWKKRIFLG